MTKMLPPPTTDNKKWEHTRPWQAKGEHAKLYTFSPTDYKNLGGIWSGSAPDGTPLEVVQGHPQGGLAPEGTPNAAGFAPDRKSTRLNSSHANISYAVFCLKIKTIAVHVA